MRKKIIVWIICIILAVAIVWIIIVTHTKEQQTIQNAQEYLAQKYDQKMKYEAVRFSWIDS